MDVQDSSDEELPPALPLEEEDADSEALQYLLHVRAEERRFSTRAKPSETPDPVQTQIQFRRLELPVSATKMKSVLEHFQGLRTALAAVQVPSFTEYAKGAKMQWWSYFNEPRNQPWTDYTVRMSQRLVRKLLNCMLKWGLESHLPDKYETWIFALLAVLGTPLLAETEANLTSLGKILGRDLSRLEHVLLLLIITEYFHLRIFLD